MSVYQKHALDYLSYIYNVEIYGKNHENTPPPTELYANILVHLVGTKRINNDKFTQNSHGIINDTLLPTYMYRPTSSSRSQHLLHSLTWLSCTPRRRRTKQTQPSRVRGKSETVLSQELCRRNRPNKPENQKIRKLSRLSLPVGSPYQAGICVTSPSSHLLPFFVSQYG